MSNGQHAYLSASADLARERMLGRLRRPHNEGSAGRVRGGWLQAGVVAAVTTAAVLGLLGSFALPYVSAQREQSLALASSAQKTASLQKKLDQWMVAAAQRESEIKAQLSDRDHMITTLRQEMESAEVERRASAQMAEQLAVLESRRDELARSLAAAQRDLLDTKAVYARDLARTESDARSRRALEQQLDSARRALEQSQVRSQSLEQELRSLRQELAKQQDEHKRKTATGNQAPSESEDVEALREAAQLAARKLAALRGSLPGDPVTRAALDALRQSATAELFEKQGRLASSIDSNGLYTVRESDTLTQIAARLMGGPNRWRELYQVNRHILGSADEIHPGTPLVLPSIPSREPDSLAQGKPEVLL